MLHTGRRAPKISHDKIFKTLIRLTLQDFVELFERDIGAQLDFAQVEHLSGEAFAELKKAGHLDLDLVARVGRRGPPQPPLLAEIEARFRGDIAARMWKYFTTLSAQNLDALLLPVVVYLKGGPPGLCEQVKSAQIGSFSPVTFRYLSLGLSGCLAEEWLKKPQTLVGALAALMRSKIWDRVEHKLHCMRRVLAEVNLERQYILAQVVENYLKLNPEEDERYRAALSQEKKSMVPFPLTFAEALQENEARGIAVGEARGIAVGEARGIAVGEARGIAVGEARAMRESILLLLEHRFGAAAAPWRDRLMAVSDLTRLREILARVVAVSSLDQLDAGLV